MGRSIEKFTEEVEEINEEDPSTLEGNRQTNNRGFNHFCVGFDTINRLNSNNIIIFNELKCWD